MIKLSDYRELCGKEVKVVCIDNKVFEGRWSEYFSAEANAEHAIDNDREPPGESIEVGITEIFASDIVSITAVNENITNIRITDASPAFNRLQAQA